MIVQAPACRRLFLLCLITDDRLNSHGAVDMRIVIFWDLKPSVFFDG